ncbi:hypothetical protein ALI144C_27225 [Actinosynnema sp. ALI-1.44]|nr:hypothetical protein ALI144C_27225 [Actinosynnema sp. ALI-1.44]
MKRLRAQAGLTLDQVAERTDYDKGKLSRTERAEMGITGDVVLTLCEAYGVDKDVANSLAELARQSRRRGWWHQYLAELTPKLADLLELEADSRSINVFTIDVITGLLQTRAYYEALLQLANPTVDKQQLEQRGDLRMERKDRAREAGTEVWAVINEAALMHPVGGKEVMAAQLEHVVQLVEERVATVQILPLSLPGHAAMGIPFSLYNLKDGATFASLDTLLGGLYLEDQVDVDAYRYAWTQLTANSLGFHESMSILKQKIREHRS